MKQYELTFIVNPSLPGDGVKLAANMYIDFIKSEGCEIVHIDEMGVRQLTYPIKKSTSGAYFSIEFKTTDSKFVDKIELAFRRDERILRFLTIAFDKHSIKYADDKRKGLIGKKRADELAAKKAAAAAALIDEDDL